MGVCSSSKIQVKTKSKVSFDKKEESKLSHTSTAKEMQSGEIYYLKRKVSAFHGNITGGKDKIQLFFSLKIQTENDVPDSEVNLNMFQMVRIGMHMASLNDKNTYEFVGETEELEEGSLKYYTTYIIDYIFEKKQEIKFEIKNHGKIIDTIETTLGRIMGSRGQIIDFPVNFPFDNQNLHSKLLFSVSAVSVKEKIKNTFIHFDIQASFLNYNDYFVIISSGKEENGKPERLYKSLEKQGKDIVFIARDLNLNDVCFGDKSKEIIFDFYTPNSSTSLGGINTNLNVLTYNENLTINDSKGNQVGTCRIYYDTQEIIKFVEYLERGLQISLIVGVDYTASNGIPTDDTSLHYLYGREPNHYEQAIRSCGSVVAYYDYDQKFPVFGFGGMLQGEPTTSHCFNCTLSSDPNTDGVEGIISTYRKSLTNVVLDGPTYFYPLIKKIVDLVLSEMQNANSSVYYMLLILTDGKIHDMDKTRDIICEAASLPISIIIIGIGDDDFSNMVELDGDFLPLTNKKGEKIERDIVQFVKFNDFKFDANKLAEEVLCEVPTQVEQYYKQYKNFKSTN